jgi:hypothetical protein
VNRNNSGVNLLPSRSFLRGSRALATHSDLADPFAVNPIRRSAGLVAVCAGLLILPWWINEALATTIMLSVGWLAVTGLVIGLPVLIWSLAEEAIGLTRARLRPPVSQLEISARLIHVLQRHGYESIDDVDRASDEVLAALSNMDPRGLREVRRAVTVWKYRRWQERGFPVTDGRP